MLVKIGQSGLDERDIFYQRADGKKKKLTKKKKIIKKIKLIKNEIKK